MFSSYMVKVILGYLNLIKVGKLTINHMDGTQSVINKSYKGLEANITILDKKFFSKVIARGDIGFGEAYVNEYFSTTNLHNLLLLLALNLEDLDKISRGTSLISKISFKIVNLIRRNSIKQSKKNIEYHYDIGNNFYKLWLDSSMTYSSAIYKKDTEDLDTAQKNKYHRILDILENNMGSNLNIFEIGSGFGGFAEEALKRGHNITTITISKGHYEYTQDRLKHYIDAGKCKLLLQDYRTINEKFDAVVSIEMFEAVGLEFWDEYFSTVNKNLKDNGHAVIQAISIKEKYYEGYKNSSDFIRHYIFPGGFLPTINSFEENSQSAGMMVHDVYSFGLDYAKTLLEWEKLFDSKLQEISNMGYSQQFIRMWRYYLLICVAGFESTRIDVSQFHIIKKTI